MPTPLLVPSPPVEGQVFADAVCRLAGSVAIVTWQGGGPRGLLVRGVSLLSTRPPRVLFGVDKEHPDHADLLGVEVCALNLLSDVDEAEAQRFAAPLPIEDRFSPERWRLRGRQPPRLLAGAVHLSGVIDHRIDARSHSLFVVNVDAAEVNDRTPLVSFDHGFRTLAQPSRSAGTEIAAHQDALSAVPSEETAI